MPSQSVVSELAPTGVLRAAINMGNFLLVTGKTPSGDPSGVSADIAAAIAARLGVPVKYLPYAPGGLDTWENLWLQRSAAHPWCGMRNMAALIGSGVMDRYPKLRIGTLEAGHGWLPFWIARLDEHAETIKAALPRLKRRPSEYVTSGRYFQSIEIPEGAPLTNAVADLLGDDVLMYASDYPHGESHFPASAGIVLGWDMAQARKRKLMWDNAVRLYARAGVG